MEETAVAVINTKLDNILFQLTALAAGHASLDGRVRMLETTAASNATRIASVERAVDRPKGSWQTTMGAVASVLSVLVVVGALVYLGPH